LQLITNRLTYECAPALRDALTINTSLTLLSLNGNTAFGDPGCLHLGEALAENKTLTTLFLGKCEIGDEGAIAIARGLTVRVYSFYSLALLHLPSDEWLCCAHALLQSSRFKTLFAGHVVTVAPPYTFALLS
jgi:hypothetical protein